MSSEGHTNCAETIAQIKTEKESSKFKGNMDVGGKRTSQRHKICAVTPRNGFELKHGLSYDFRESLVF
jgi:hypothetical protein